MSLQHLPIDLDGEPVAVRAMEPGDREFVLSTWLNSEGAHQHTSKVWTRARFFAWRRPVVEHHVGAGGVIVACAPETPGTIYGWLCATAPGVYEYAYVIPAARGRGLYKALRRWLEE